MKPPIQQAKENILKILRATSSDIQEIIYPCLPQDLADYRSALELVEVQQEFNRRGVKARAILQTELENQIPQEIVIATIDDVASGKLDNYLKKDRMS